MLVQFMWVTENEKHFELSVPVLWHGVYLQTRGWSNQILLCFLQGLELLSGKYLALLRDAGYEIIDGSHYITDALRHYPNILKLPITSRYWFLRWNVLHAIALERRVKTVIHLDGDVVLLADPKELAEDVAGKTFMLQGCPAFTVISDYTWFEIWSEELGRMLENRAAYIANAIMVKSSPLHDDRDFCNICAYSSNRFEDQDMLEYLIAAARLPQAFTSEVFNSEFYWIQNPLLPGEWHVEQAGNAPRQIVELNGQPHVGSKSLALYHFQTNFALYCHTWMQLSHVGMQSLAALVKPTGNSRKNSKLLDLTGRTFDFVNKPVNRCAAYQNVSRINPRTGNRYITDIVNSCWD